MMYLNLASKGGDCLGMDCAWKSNEPVDCNLQQPKPKGTFIRPKKFHTFKTRKNSIEVSRESIKETLNSEIWSIQRKIFKNFGNETEWYWNLREKFFLIFGHTLLGWPLFEKIPKKKNGNWFIVPFLTGNLQKFKWEFLVEWKVAKGSQGTLTNLDLGHIVLHPATCTDGREDFFQNLDLLEHNMLC